MNSYSHFSAWGLVSLGLINPKSATNVASILRAAGCYGASSVFYTGQRYGYAKDFNADTRQMHKQIPTIGVESLQVALPKGATPVVVELVEGATPLPAYTHPENAFYVFGPEDGSVSQDIVDWCRDVVYIPTNGCMNLAATVNVLLYDRLAKSELRGGNSLIQASRDINNRTRVKN
ncbi:RNA methyltransferase [Salinimonas sp. HHU 13199]|uniref:RNA methyltransferase n=1 Tax=Salinimonas profundi TaxID=2729140 RepID=A0ABR8LKW6_9ALTE|nr:RNA methyltransferase [Salinimonas profundi]MBD3584574.1 RNA methyltransferase [Salinimonas profundi]